MAWVTWRTRMGWECCRGQRRALVLRSFGGGHWLTCVPPPLYRRTSLLLGELAIAEDESHIWSFRQITISRAAHVWFKASDDLWWLAKSPALRGSSAELYASSTSRDQSASLDIAPCLHTANIWDIVLTEMRNWLSPKNVCARESRRLLLPL